MVDQTGSAMRRRAACLRRAEAVGEAVGSLGGRWGRPFGSLGVMDLRRVMVRLRRRGSWSSMGSSSPAAVSAKASSGSPGRRTSSTVAPGKVSLSLGHGAVMGQGYGRSRRGCRRVTPRSAAMTARTAGSGSGTIAATVPSSRRTSQTSDDNTDAPAATAAPSSAPQAASMRADWLRTASRSPCQMRTG